MPTKLKNLKLIELSLVDHPANKHARIAIFKREGELPAAIAKEVEAMDFNEVLAERDARMRQSEIENQVAGCWYTLQESFATIAVDPSLGADAKIKAMQSSLNQFIEALSEAPDVEKALARRFEKSPALAVLKVGRADATNHDGDDDMDLKQEVEQLNGTVADLTKKLADADTALATVTKARDDATSALTAAEAARKSAEEDEVLIIGEEPIRKSAVGESVFKAMKVQQDQIAKANEARELVELQKRAETELNGLPGETIAKAHVLRAVEGLPEDVRKSLSEMLKAGAAAVLSKTREMGQGGSRPTEGAQSELDALINKYAEDHKVTVTIATDAVLKTAAGNSLFQQARLEKRQRAA
jgi:hypothetical protein